MKSIYISFILLFVYSLSFSQHTELWGTAEGNSAFNPGSIFKVDENGENFEVIYTPEICLVDLVGKMKLLNNEDGFLYGVSNSSIFKVDTLTNDVALLKNIYGGYSAGLIKTSDSRILGMTSSGGVNNKGSIFEYFAFEDSIVTLYSFTTLNYLAYQDLLVKI